MVDIKSLTIKTKSYKINNLPILLQHKANITNQLIRFSSNYGNDDLIILMINSDEIKQSLHIQMQTVINYIHVYVIIKKYYKNLSLTIKEELLFKLTPLPFITNFSGIISILRFYIT